MPIPRSHDLGETLMETLEDNCNSHRDMAVVIHDLLRILEERVDDEGGSDRVIDGIADAANTLGELLEKTSAGQWDGTHDGEED